MKIYLAILSSDNERFYEYIKQYYVKLFIPCPPDIFLCINFIYIKMSRNVANCVALLYLENFASYKYCKFMYAASRKCFSILFFIQTTLLVHIQKKTGR